MGRARARPRPRRGGRGAGRPRGGEGRPSEGGMGSKKTFICLKKNLLHIRAIMSQIKPLFVSKKTFMCTVPQRNAM